MKAMFDDWRYQALVKYCGRWHVVVDPGGTTFDGEVREWIEPVLRPVRWWSPRDLIRFPLHRMWERRYW